MTDQFKLIILPTTKVGMTRAELHHHLEFIHGPLVMKYPDVSGGFAEYVHHYVTCAQASAAEVDAVTVLSFASMADMVASKANENYQRHVYADEDNFREEAASRAFSGLAHIVHEGPRDTPVKLLIFRRLRDGGDAPGAWENHVAAVLGGGALGAGRVVVNRLSPLGGPGDYDILDEIGVCDDAGIDAIKAALDNATEGLLAGPSKVLVTRPRVFV